MTRALSKPEDEIVINKRQRSRGAICVRVMHYTVAPSKQRAQGMPGAGRTRKPRGLKRKNAHKSSGKAEIARHSLRNGFTAYSALSPGYRAF